MKKGQLLSQPLFYIFAIVVIGLILIFGFNYLNKVIKIGCEVEILDFNADLQTKISELYSLSYGSSYECALVQYSGQSENSCEFVLPQDIRGLCFVDTSKPYDTNEIKFLDVKNLVSALGSGANRNLFYSSAKSGSCKAEE